MNLITDHILGTTCWRSFLLTAITRHVCRSTLQTLLMTVNVINFQICIYDLSNFGTVETDKWMGKLCMLTIYLNENVNLLHARIGGQKTFHTRKPLQIRQCLYGIEFLTGLLISKRQNLIRPLRSDELQPSNIFLFQRLFCDDLERFFTYLQRFASNFVKRN